LVMPPSLMSGRASIVMCCIESGRLKKKKRRRSFAANKLKFF
jgi:hypothetical protein